MTDLAQRIERLERLLGVGPPGSGGGEGDHTGVPGPPQAPQEGAPDGSLSAWVRARKRPGNVVVGIGVSASDGGVASAHQIFDRPQVPFDLAHVAGLCQALASETRLAMLRELFAGERSTAELMEAVGLDRGQLYHHLRDLFVHGLVRQPVRGRYVLTGRGACIFLGAGIVSELGGREGPSVPFEPGEPGESADAPPSAPRGGGALA
jgi:DNA-binding transcriptional ArsR family regulator